MNTIEIDEAVARPATQPSTPLLHRTGQRLIVLIVMLMAVAGLSVTTAGAASAAPAAVGTLATTTVTGCWDGRCTVYLSQSETRALGSAKLPKASLASPFAWLLTVTARTHIWIARQYAAHNYCSAFTLNIRPWATQGYYGYRCNWR